MLFTFFKITSLKTVIEQVEQDIYLIPGILYLIGCFWYNAFI